jgi:hypothetical protein
MDKQMREAGSPFGASVRNREDVDAVLVTFSLLLEKYYRAL